jgi:hypothetical protein
MRKSVPASASSRRLPIMTCPEFNDFLADYWPGGLSSDERTPSEARLTAHLRRVVSPREDSSDASTSTRCDWRHRVLLARGDHLILASSPRAVCRTNGLGSRRANQDKTDVTPHRSVGIYHCSCRMAPTRAARSPLRSTRAPPIYRAQRYAGDAYTQHKAKQPAGTGKNLHVQDHSSIRHGRLPRGAQVLPG